jgi:transcriptional regulator with XRE-family HTH domain
MTFVIRKLNDAETLGQKLKVLRLASHLTVSEMAFASKLQRHIIEAFENDRHDRLPEPIYARKFLKTYVQTLGGDADYFLQRYEDERGTCDFTKAARLPLRRARAIQFLVASKFVKFGVLGVFALALVAYLGGQLRAITAPPNILVLEPPDGVETNDATVRVAGQADGEVTVKVNGEEVLLDQQGYFETEVALERGLNIISVEGAKRYSRTATEYRRVVLDQEMQPLGFGN